jgi:hypothetical protein
MHRLRSLVVMMLLNSFYLPAAPAQSGPIRIPRIPEERTGQDADTQRKLGQQQQNKRFEDMKRDSQRLLELATELKQNVDKSGENVLSMDVVRKAEEMEKLARRLKNYMRGE